MKSFIKNKLLKRTKRIKTDLFIKRLKCSVIGEGMLNDGNIYLLDYAIKNIANDEGILEIGSYGGLSTNLILHLLKKHNKTNLLYTCDAWVYEGYEDHIREIKPHIDGRDDIDRKKYMSYIKESFINATKFLHSDSLPHSCCMKSDAFFEKWNNNIKLNDVFNRSFRLPKKNSFFLYRWRPFLPTNSKRFYECRFQTNNWWFCIN